MEQKDEELTVEYIPGSSRPFVVRLGRIEECLTESQFKAFFADMEAAAQAYEAERTAIKLDLKTRYEAARERR